MNAEKPRHLTRNSRVAGFTLIELLIGGTIMVIVLIGTLTIYMRANRITVDQQQFAEVQHQVRSSMYILSRDVRSAGVGLTSDIAGYFMEGVDSFSPGDAGADSLKLLGNFDEPLGLIIEKYQGGAGGGSATAFLYQWSLESSPYPCPDFYENRVVLIISTRCPGCFTFRYIPQNSVFGCGTGEEHLNMQPGASEINPPGGLIDTGCSEDCWDDAIITLGDIRYFWLDTTGIPGDYPTLNLTVGANGYLGIPDTLYMSTINEETAMGSVMHIPIAQDIENLQFQFNGDIDADGILDGWMDWQAIWTGDTATISRIQQVRIWILGRTANPYVSVSGTPSSDIHNYRRPSIANSPVGLVDDLHRRFLLDSTVTVRNMVFNIYNTGTR